MPYVIFLNYVSPKSATINIHVTDCIHYQKHRTRTTKNTRWEEVGSSLKSAETRAEQLHIEYGTLGVKRAKCCIKTSP